MVPFLIVFDNADDPSILSSYWPSSKQGSVIITSNNPTTREEGYAQHGITTTTFDHENGPKFLLSLLDGTNWSPEDIRAVHDLSQQYDGLALCLRQAASFMRSKRCSPSQFFKLYQTRHAEIDTFPIPNYNKNVITVWNMSMSMLSSDSMVLLDVLSLFDPDSIPTQLFYPKQVKHKYGAFLEDPLDVLNAVEGLLSQSFVEFNRREETLRMHRFFQMATFRRLSQSVERFQNSIHLAIELIHNYLPEDEFVAVRQPQRWKYIEGVLSHAFSVYRQTMSSPPGHISAMLLQCLSHLVK